MIINETTINVLDTNKGNYLKAEKEIDITKVFINIINNFYARITEKDDVKISKLTKNSAFINIISNYKNKTNNFIKTNGMLADRLYEIMSSNINIPSADLLVSHISDNGEEFLLILKMNYQKLYGHIIKDSISKVKLYDDLISNGKGCKVTEAALISLDNSDIVKFIEKKQNINEEKINYFSEMYLMCNDSLTAKAKVKRLYQALIKTEKMYYDYDEDRKLRDKAKITALYEEDECYDTAKITKELYSDNPEIADFFDAFLDKFNIQNEKICLIDENTTKILGEHKIITESGIEIKISLFDNAAKDIKIKNDHSEYSTMEIKFPNKED